MAFLGFDPQLASALLTAVQLTVCPLQDAPRVEAYLAYDPPVYNANYTSAALKKSMQNNDPDTTHSGETGLLMGVTSSKVTDRTNVYFSLLSDKRGNTCIYPTRIVLNIRYDAGVFIASEIKNMECSYKITMAHENQHVRYDLQTLNEYLPRIQLEMMHYLKSFGYQGRGPFRASEASSVQKELMEEIRRAAAPMYERMREVRRARQESLDTVESYRKQGEICDMDKEKLREVYRTTYVNDKKTPDSTPSARARKTNPTK
ncbi:MAG TPA: hypothetical protein VHP34_06675 [Alphaproteobacteria bacterium]|jgi:hypothetical protein|nr:hypothetical protein [Alphaproteobacteria bacterium]